MSEAEDRIETTRVSREQGEQRSATAAIQGLAATGAATYGIGQLLEGVAKVKEAFGEKQPAPPPPSESKDNG